jgi:hypothetical protein
MLWQLCSGCSLHSVLRSPLQAGQASAAKPKAPRTQPPAPEAKVEQSQGSGSFTWPHFSLPKQHVSYLESFLLADDGFF